MPFFANDILNALVVSDPTNGGLMLKASTGLAPQSNDNPLIATDTTNGGLALKISLIGGVTSTGLLKTPLALSATLQVVEDYAGTDSPLYLSQTAIGLGTTSIWDNANGRLGIGTTSPLKPLHVIGGIALTAGSANDRIESGGVNSVLIVAGSNNALLLDGSISTFGYWGASSSHSILVKSGGSGNSNRDGMDLIIGSGQSTGNEAGGDILFKYTPAGASGTQANPYSTAMAISGATGNVGIGTTTPTDGLTIKRNSTGLSVQITDNSTGYNEFAFRNASGTTIAEILSTVSISSYGTQNGGLGFFTNGIGAIPQMVIASAGNIGINTISPTAQLDVKGSGTSSTTTSLLVQNSNSTGIFKVRDDGTVYIYQNSSNSVNDLEIYHDYTSGATAYTNLTLTTKQLNGNHGSQLINFKHVGGNAGTFIGGAVGCFLYDSGVGGYSEFFIKTKKSGESLEPRFIIDSNGNLILGKHTATNEFIYIAEPAFVGSYPLPTRTITIKGNNTQASGWGGYGLTIKAGNANNVLSSNLKGGELYLRSGESLGTGVSDILFQVPIPAGAPSTTLNSTYQTAMFISGNTKIGINNTSPVAQLDIVAAASTVGLYVKGHATGTPDIARFYQSDGTTYSKIDSSSNMTLAGSMTVPGNLNVTSSSFFTGVVWSATGTDLRLGTNSFGTVLTITSATGLVGINEASPDNQLHITTSSTSASTTGLKIENTGALSAYANITMTSTAGSAQIFQTASTYTGVVRAASMGVYQPTVGGFAYYQEAITSTTGTRPSFSIETSFTAGAGAALYRPLQISYTINNSGAQSGTATGIFLNATETALNSMTHRLMDLQVGGSSVMMVRNSGKVVTQIIGESSSGDQVGSYIAFTTGGGGINAQAAYVQLQTNSANTVVFRGGVSEDTVIRPYDLSQKISMVGATQTGSSAIGTLSITQTWNTSGTPTAILANITDTASNAASLLMDLQVGGVSKFKVTKAGDATFGGQITVGYAGLVDGSNNGTGVNLGNGSGVKVGSTGQIGFTSGGPASSVDTTITRSAAGIFATAGAFLFDGGTGKTLQYTNAGSAPGTDAIGVVVDYYGTSATRVLTTPTTWFIVKVAGTEYKVPAY